MAWKKYCPVQVGKSLSLGRVNGLIHRSNVEMLQSTVLHHLNFNTLKNLAINLTMTDPKSHPNHYFLLKSQNSKRNFIWLASTYPSNMKYWEPGSSSMHEQDSKLENKTTGVCQLTWRESKCEFDFVLKSQAMMN